MTRTVVELTCSEVVERVTDYLGRHLQPAERGALEQHLLVCPPCATYLDQMKTVAALAAALDEAPAEPSDHAAALELLRRWKRGAP